VGILSGEVGRGESKPERPATPFR